MQTVLILAGDETLASLLAGQFEEAKRELLTKYRSSQKDQGSRRLLQICHSFLAFRTYLEVRSRELAQTRPALPGAGGTVS